jgi:hypothetical protein
MKNKSFKPPCTGVFPYFAPILGGKYRDVLPVKYGGIKLIFFIRKAFKSSRESIKYMNVFINFVIK